MSRQVHEAVFTANNRDFNRKADEVSGKMRGMSSGARAMASKLVAYFAVAFSLAVLSRFTKGAVEAAKKTGNLSDAAQGTVKQMAALSNTFDEVKESIGRAILESDGFKKALTNLETTAGNIKKHGLLGGLFLSVGPGHKKRAARQAIEDAKAALFDVDREGNATVIKETTVTINSLNETLKKEKDQLLGINVQDKEAIRLQLLKIKGIEDQIKAVNTLVQVQQRSSVVAAPGEGSFGHLKGPSGEQLGIPKMPGLAETTLEVKKITTSLTLAQQAALSFSEEMKQAGIESGRSLKDFARVAVQVAKKIIATYLAESVAAAVKKAMTSVPFPFNIIAAGVAGGLAAAAFNAAIPDFASGGAAFGPTMALVGEAPGISRSNPEYIGTAKQLSQMGMGGRLTARVSRGDLLFVLNEGQAAAGRNY